MSLFIQELERKPAAKCANNRFAPQQIATSGRLFIPGNEAH